MQLRYRVMIFGIAMAVAGNNPISGQRSSPDIHRDRQQMVMFYADPFVGVWNLDVDKSKFDPGPPLKSGKAKIEAQGEAIRCILDPVSAEGQARHGEWEAKYDGKDYPAKMVPFADAITLSKPDNHTVLATYKRGGEEVLTERWVLSRDRRVLTMTQTEKNSKGKGFLNTLVYIRE
jgi:hypothetical protein